MNHTKQQSQTAILLGDQKELIEKLRRDLLNSKEETHQSVQEGLAYKQEAAQVGAELEGVKEQEALLTEQVEQQDNILSQLQNELKAERTRSQDLNKDLNNSRRQVGQVQEEMDSLQKYFKQTQNKVYS